MPTTNLPTQNTTGIPYPQLGCKVRLLIDKTSDKGLVFSAGTEITMSDPTNLNLLNYNILKFVHNGQIQIIKPVAHGTDYEGVDVLVDLIEGVDYEIEYNDAVNIPFWLETGTPFRSQDRGEVSGYNVVKKRNASSEFFISTQLIGKKVFFPRVHPPIDLSINTTPVQRQRVRSGQANIVIGSTFFFYQNGKQAVKRMDVVTQYPTKDGSYCYWSVTQFGSTQLVVDYVNSLIAKIRRNTSNQISIGLVSKSMNGDLYYGIESSYLPSNADQDEDISISVTASGTSAIKSGSASMSLSISSSVVGGKVPPVKCDISLVIEGTFSANAERVGSVGIAMSFSTLIPPIPMNLDTNFSDYLSLVGGHNPSNTSEYFYLGDVLSEFTMAEPFIFNGLPQYSEFSSGDKFYGFRYDQKTWGHSNLNVGGTNGNRDSAPRVMWLSQNALGAGTYHFKIKPYSWHIVGGRIQNSIDYGLQGTEEQGKSNNNRINFAVADDVAHTATAGVAFSVKIIEWEGKSTLTINQNYPLRNSTKVFQYADSVWFPKARPNQYDHVGHQKARGASQGQNHWNTINESHDIVDAVPISSNQWITYEITLNVSCVPYIYNTDKNFYFRKEDVFLTKVS